MLFLSVKKLVAITTTFMLIIETIKEALQEKSDLDLVSYICYFILYKKDTEKAKIMTFINFKGKINAMNPACMAKLDF